MDSVGVPTSVVRETMDRMGDHELMEARPTNQNNEQLSQIDPVPTSTVRELMGEQKTGELEAANPNNCHASQIDPLIVFQRKGNEGEQEPYQPESAGPTREQPPQVEQRLPVASMSNRPIQDLVERRRQGCHDDGGLLDDLGFLSKCRAKAAPGKTPVVIVSCGSFCPPHRGHLEMLTLAADALHGSTNACADVVGFFMILSPEEGIQRKHSQGRLKGGAVATASYEVRAELLRSMAKDLELPAEVHISASEQSRANWYMSNFQDLSQKAGGAQIELPSLILVTGPDRKTPLKFHFPGCAGVVTVCRDGEEVLPRSDWLPEHRESPFCVEACPPTDVFEMSSTKVREACLQALGLSKDASESQVHNKVANWELGDIQATLQDAVFPFMGTISAEMYARAVQEGKSGVANLSNRTSQI